MKNAWTPCFLTAILAVSFMAIGCGDDGGTDSGTPVDTGMPPTDTGMPPTDTGMPPTDTGTPDDAGGGGACTNMDDITYLGAHMDEVAGFATTRGQECVLGGMTGDALIDCVRDGVRMDTMDMLSAECSRCYGVSVECVAANCVTEGCVTDPEGMSCLECRCGRSGGMVNCIQAFTDCSGIPSTMCAM